jgi:cytochrome bd ubiquinol oxidase subunit II
MEYAFMIFWYIIIVAAAGCYAMLDGFDLGVGTLHLFVKKDEERRIFLNAIGPVWDANEVWLVVLIGGLLAGFPFAYATLMSAFYIPITFLIFSLIFRAIAIEFRSKTSKLWWRKSWDFLFSFASLFIAFGIGMSLGNLVVGLPLNEQHEYMGGLMNTFFRPYPILIGFLTISLFMMHGAIYLVMKTEGLLQDKLKEWVKPTMIFFIIAYVVTTMATLVYEQHMAEHLRQRPLLFLIVLANILVIANIPRLENQKKYGWAFVYSCLNIALLLTLFALGSFPDVIRSSIDPATNSITVQTAAASLKTLQVLAIIVAIGLPFVFAYGFYIYHIFKGKVEIDHMSY